MARKPTEKQLAAKAETAKQDQIDMINAPIEHMEAMMKAIGADLDYGRRNVPLRDIYQQYKNQRGSIREFADRLISRVKG